MYVFELGLFPQMCRCGCWEGLFVCSFFFRFVRLFVALFVC